MGPIDVSTVIAVRVGGEWLTVLDASFEVGEQQVFANKSSQAISPPLGPYFEFMERGGQGRKVSGPVSAIEAIRHHSGMDDGPRGATLRAF